MVKPLSFPLRLDLMQTKGVLKLIKIRTGEEYHLGSKERLMVLSGIVNHVTGTDSVTIFYIYPNSAGDETTHTEILAALASGQYPLFNTASEETQSQTPIIILKEKDCIAFDGGALSWVNLHVIWWERL